MSPKNFRLKISHRIQTVKNYWALITKFYTHDREGHFRSPLEQSPTADDALFKFETRRRERGGTKATTKQSYFISLQLLIRPKLKPDLFFTVSDKTFQINSCL